MALRCLVNFSINSKASPISVIPRRFRYYWEARPENKWRKLVMQVSLPRLGAIPPYEPKVIKDDPNKLYGLDVVLHREAKDIFINCKMVAVFLRTQMEVTDYFKMKHELRKKEIFLDDFPNHVMRNALKDTPLANMSVLYAAGETITIYSFEPNVAEMLKLTKRNPFLSLMGGVVENRFMSTSQLVNYSTLPPKETVQGMLCGTLAGLCSSTHSILGRNQSLTVKYLAQYVKDKSEA